MATQPCSSEEIFTHTINQRFLMGSAAEPRTRRRLDESVKEQLSDFRSGHVQGKG
jgi:hypothetical protein